MSLCTARPDTVYLENYRLNKVLIEEIAEYCRERNIRFLLVCINTLFGCEDEAKYRAIDPTFRSGFFDDDLRVFAELHSIEYLGLEEPFTRYCRETGRSWYWIHWNYTGHRVISSELSAKLMSIL
jgi:hypothetical protein